MSAIQFKSSTNWTPEQFTAGLTDFGPDRSKVFPSSADGCLKVHDQGPPSGAGPDGTAEVDHVVVREGKNLKGRLLGVVLGTVDKSRLANAFTSAVKAIEARNEGTSTPDSS